MKSRYNISVAAERIYTILLSIYPRDFRREFGPAMIDTFLTQWEQLTRRHGARIWLSIVGRTLADILRTAPRQRLSTVWSWFSRRLGHSPATPPVKNSTSSKGLIDSVIQDIRFGFRTLRGRPLYTTVAILTLGLGIGAATAMFSVVDGVLLNELPYREPGRLVTVWLSFPWKQTDSGNTSWNHVNLRDDQYRDLKEHNTLLPDVALYLASEWGVGTLTGKGRPESVTVGTATASLLLGVRPQLGRWFLPTEEGAAPGQAANVAVLSHEMWSRKFAGDSEAIGRTLILDGSTYTITGILPRGFRLRWLTGGPARKGDLTTQDIWVPYGQPWDCIGCGSNMYQVVGRLAPDVTVEQALSETRAILTRDEEAKEMGVRLVPRYEDETRDLASPLALLLGSTGLLLFIACGNIATLSLGEMHGRQQEVATRSALGASGSRIVRQLLTESMILGVLGGAAGALLAYAGTLALVSLAPPLPRIEEIGINLPVLAFATVMGILAGLAFGTLPAVASAGGSISEALRTGGRSGTGRGGSFQRAIVALEIALTVVLLVTAGLLTRSLSHLLAVHPGFESENLATIELSLPETSYSTEEARSKFFVDVLDQLRTIPAVTGVTATNGLPFPGRTAGWGVWVEGNRSATNPSAKLFHVAPGYHEMMGIPLLAGRTFNEADGPDAPSVAVISESLAHRLWPDESPIGARLGYPWENVTVVGIVSDTHQAALNNEPELTFYIPFVQFSRGEVSFAARTNGDPNQVIPLMRQAVWSVDDNIAINHAGSMASLITQSTREEQYRTLLMMVFGIAAAVLAAVGIFGVTARSVAHRTREFGIRMALGAKDKGLVGMVLRNGLVTGLVGTALGLLGAAWAAVGVSRFLFGVEPSDPLTYGTVASLLLIVCLVASYLPARKIAKVDPVEVLRTE